MKVVTTNLLNRFWKNGVKPIKDALTGKLDSSRIINSLLATEAGFALDARQGKVLDDKLTELNGNMGGMKYKVYDIPPKTWNKGSNDTITLDVSYSKIRSISAALYSNAVKYVLPIIPMNADGDYTLSFAADFYLKQDNKLVIRCGGTWSGYGLHIIVGYVD